jgi:mRNA-degrading endonuclease toxin of MazEF toxin-antitoxin module
MTVTMRNGVSDVRKTRRCDFTYVPNIGSSGGKVRPALVVQSDHNNARLSETILAAITSNTSRVHEDTQLLIEVTTPDGAASGLLHDSAVRCERLHSIPQADVRRVISKLADALMKQIGACLKAALGRLAIPKIPRRVREYFGSRGDCA